jgi:hypothetical protein
MMKISVRSADLKSDRTELVGFLHENLTTDSNARRFDWLYLDNPAGEARAWMARDSDSGATVGVAAAFPRQFWIDGSLKRVWTLGDFCISNRCRSLGPALQLQRKCLDGLGDDLWYDFPSRSMMAVYKRLGVPACSEVVRYAKLLRVDDKVANRVSSRFLSVPIRAAGNALLRLRSRSIKSNGLQFSVLNGAFDAEFTALNAPGPRESQVRGLRSAEFLNWRYRKDPLRQFVVLVARQQSALMGYVAASVRDRDARLVDVQALGEGACIPAMLAELENRLLQENVQRLSIPVLADFTFLQHLKTAGFRPREGCPVVLPRGIPASNWVFLDGDRDS